MNRDVFDMATKLRADSSLKTPDALHLAAGKSLTVLDLAALDEWLL